MLQGGEGVEFEEKLVELEILKSQLCSHILGLISGLF